MQEQRTETPGAVPALATARHRLPNALVGNALMRIAGGASGALAGLYLADLANRGAPVNAALVGTLGAVSFGAELVAAAPMGMLSDAVAPRRLMTVGALLGAVATQLFGITGRTAIFFLSRAIEDDNARVRRLSLRGRPHLVAVPHSTGFEAWGWRIQIRCSDEDFHGRRTTRPSEAGIRKST